MTEDAQRCRARFGKAGAFTIFLSGLAMAALDAALAQQAQWSEMQRMELEGQYAGPLRDTIIQRLRDPHDGTVCYIYLPITAPHTPPRENTYVQYGPNVIGSISCVTGARLPEPSPEAK